jgi:23S rRNA (uridine2552-2'-O)-methyltransferase
MEPIPGVEFMQGDFHDEEFVERFEEILGGRQVDLVMSDIAPNISGIPSSDQARSVYLAELALDFAQKHLAQGGRFLVKVFQGKGSTPFASRWKTSSSLCWCASPRRPGQKFGGLSAGLGQACLGGEGHHCLL